MASSKPLAFMLLFLNLIMYIIVAAIAGWVLNYGIDETPHEGKLSSFKGFVGLNLTEGMSVLRNLTVKLLIVFDVSCALGSVGIVDTSSTFSNILSSWKPGHRILCHLLSHRWSCRHCHFTHWLTRSLDGDFGQLIVSCSFFHHYLGSHTSGHGVITLCF